MKTLPGVSLVNRGDFHCRFAVLWLLALMLICVAGVGAAGSPRERLSFNDGWLFAKDDPEGIGDALAYNTLKPWLLPSAAKFTQINTNVASAKRPDGNVGADVACTQSGFDDNGWRKVTLPHDWAIEGPFKQEYPGETGKLKWWGPVWYRKHFTLPATDAGKQIYLDVDGAMSYASVWVNGQFAGGWPYGYASFRVDMTPFVKPGAENVVAIRLDSPPESSRWYPGSGLYRNVWLVKTEKVHVGQWGTQIATPRVNKDAADVSLLVNLMNDSSTEAEVTAVTTVFELNSKGEKGKIVRAIPAPGGPPESFRWKITPGTTTNIWQIFQISVPKL